MARSQAINDEQELEIDSVKQMENEQVSHRWVHRSQICPLHSFNFAFGKLS